MSSNQAPGYLKRPEHRVDTRRADGRVRVVFNGATIADSVDVARVEETGHEPVFYFPRRDVRMELLARTDHRTHCPFKGDASYWTLSVGDRIAENAVWSYEQPYDEAMDLKERLAFYESKVDAIAAGPTG